VAGTGCTEHHSGQPGPARQTENGTKMNELKWELNQAWQAIKREWLVVIAIIVATAVSVGDAWEYLW
jgi:hypothetical protein